MEFVKFPKTPHLFILPGLNIRNDKVMSEKEAEDFLNGSILVEEKVDGANVGFSLDNGKLNIQNRGHFLSGEDHPQFGPIYKWANKRRKGFSTYLADRYIVFGEWCYAQHSIRYDSLPDWFLAFDLYDRENQCFLTVEDRNALLQRLGIFGVPFLKEGVVTKKELTALVESSSSKIGNGQLEGLYLRKESGGRLVGRAKLVRKNFLQEIDVHWSKGSLKVNKCSETSPSPGS